MYEEKEIKSWLKKGLLRRLLDHRSTQEPASDSGLHDSLF
jgi:hypothetical protein